MLTFGGSVNAASNEIETIILHSLDKIDLKVDNIHSKLDTMSDRVSVLETWKDQQTVNISRFLDVDWKSSKVEINNMSNELAGVENRLASIHGAVMAFMVIGSIVSFVLNIIITLWLSKKKEPLFTIDDRSQVIRMESNK